MTGTPEVAIADPRENANRILDVYSKAKDEQVELLVLPELCITGYTTQDLFYRSHVLKRSNEVLLELAKATNNGPAMAVGMPLEVNGVLYNCAAMLANGEIQGIVPKSYVPNDGVFYEGRWFTSGIDVVGQSVKIAGKEVLFGTDQLFEINGHEVAMEICEDMFAPISPAAYSALAGAKVVVNLSASNEVIGKPDTRRTLVSSSASKLNCAYVYVSAGRGESNADTVYGGHQIISELGRIVKELEPLKDSDENFSLIYDIDCAYITHERIRSKTWGSAANQYRLSAPKYRVAEIKVNTPTQGLHRRVNPSTYKPTNSISLDKRCEYIFDIMSRGLAKQIRKGRTSALVLGKSGGLDSTLAFLTCIDTCDKLGLPHDFIKAQTMPANASSDRTQNNAEALVKSFGASHRVMPISNISSQAMNLIGHDGLTEDIAFENTHARMRTLLLMNYANSVGGIVVGTGDLSEIFQGWSTFNGDHMSFYNPNAGVPKTLVRSLVGWYAENRATESTRQILQDILDTPISPELTGNGELSQTTEDIIGPYELLDFFNQEENRRGSSPEKIGYLASIAFKDVYEEDIIEKWVDSYFTRFTGTQMKRDVMPNGVKVGQVSGSPRSDLRMAPEVSRDWFR